MSNIIVGGGSTVSVTASTSSSYTVDGGGTLVVSATVSGGATVSSGGVIELLKGNISGTTVDGGYVVVNGGNILAATTTVSGGGTVELLTSGAAVSGSLNFGAGSNTLQLDKILSSATGKGVTNATIGGFGSNDTIVVLGGYSSDSIGYSNSGDTVTFSATSGGNSVTQVFNFASSVQNDFDLLASPSIAVDTPGSAATTSAGVELTFGSDVTVASGAELYVYSGGSATNSELVSGGTIDLTDASATLSGSLTFSGGGNTLLVTAVASAGAGDQAAISGMGITDVIDVAAISAAGASLGFSTSNGNEVVIVSGTSGGGAVTESFIFSGTTTDNAATMGLGSDGSGGAELLYTAGIVTVSTSTASGAYTLTSGQTLKVVAGGSVSAVTVENGGNLVISGGVDAGAFVQSGGTEVVSAGSATQDQISGAATVAAGGDVTSEAVANGGSLTVSGGVDSAATVASGGAEFVSAGGSASGDQISGALGVIGATISGETIESGGSATLGAGAVDTGMILLAGGQLLVSAATGSASLSNDQIYGSVATVSSHSATFTNETVYGGGQLFLQNSNNATGTTVFGGGALVLSGKETATNTTLSGGGALLELESPKASLAGSLTFVNGGNELEFADISSATYGDNAVMSGFSATDQIEITSAAYAYSDLTLSQTVNSAGNTVATLTSAGAVVETFIFAGASLDGDLSLVSDNYGGSILEITPTPTTTDVTSATASGAYNLTLNQTLQVDSGGGVIDPTVGSGAFLVVNGGVDSGAIVQSGGLETVSAGSASGDQIFGSVVVFGGVVSNETVQDGGVLIVDPGTASNTLLNGGATLELTGADAALTGSLTFANGDNSLIVPASATGDNAVISGYSTNDKIEVAGMSASGATLSFAPGANGEEIATITNGGQSQSFTFADGTTYNASTMSLAPDGANVDLVLDSTPALTITTMSGLTTNQANYLVNGQVTNVVADPYVVGSTVDVFENGDVVGAGVVGADGYWSANVALANADGANALTASVTDAAGNTGATASPLTIAANAGAPAFTPGNLVLSIYGDGAGTGTYALDQAAPITLEQITTSGAVVSQNVLPETTTTVNGVTEYAISGEYGSASEGLLQLSADGHSLTIVGYGVNYQAFNASNDVSVYGANALGQTTSLSDATVTPVARVVADVNADGVIDTSTALYNIFDSNNPRSVATVDGTAFWLAGQGVKGDTTQGVFYAADGATTASAINTASDTRIAEIYNGELYVSADSTQGPTTNISDYGALPTSTAAPIVLTGIGPTVTLNGANGNSVNGSTGTVYLSPESFFFANADTLYVADGGVPKNGGIGDGGLQKWSDINGTWTLDYTLSAGLNQQPNTSASGVSGLIGLTGEVEGGNVVLYATSETIGELDQSYLYTITDTLASTTGAGESFTTVMTAAPDQIIRGVAFAPTVYAPAGLADASIVNGAVNAAGDTASQTLSGTADAGNTVTVYDGTTSLGTTTADATTGDWSFTLGQLANGAHSLTATETDAEGLVSSASAALAFTVDQGPTAANGTLTIGHGQSENVTSLLDGLVTLGLSGDVETLTAVSAMSGTATLSNGVATYVAPASGTDTISYTVTDQLANSATGSVTVTVDPGPTAANGKLVLGAGVSENITNLLDSLVTPGLAGDTETLTDVSATAGKISLRNGVATYVAPASGSATISYSVADKFGDKATGTVKVTVEPNQGAGNYNLSFNQGSVLVVLGNGNDQIGLTGAGNVVDIGNGNEKITGGSGAIMLGAGNDTVSLTGVGNSVTIGNGNENVNAGGGSDTVVLGAGNSTVTLAGSGNNVTAGNGNDTITGGAGNNVITLGQGNQNVSVGGVGDVIVVGAGNSTIKGGAGSETITAGTGHDAITLGGTGNNVTLNGSTATVSGGQGSDIVMANGGQDNLSFGGTGSTASLNGTIEASIADLGSALLINIGSSTQTDTITGFGSTDRLGIIDLLNGAGGFASVTQVLDALHSDGHGGTLLSLGAHGSIDFSGVSGSQLTAANFRIG